MGRSALPPPSIPCAARRAQPVSPRLAGAIAPAPLLIVLPPLLAVQLPSSRVSSPSHVCFRYFFLQYNDFGSFRPLCDATCSVNLCPACRL